jgi:DNA-binding NtrC family response regulator
MTSQTENYAAKRKILIVDDDRLFGDVLKDDLSSRNLEPTVLHSVADARRLCSKSAFDLVLLDNHLPDGSGLEVLPDILSLNDRAKVIMITAFPNFNNAVQAIKNGAYDYISKPIDLDELHITIERALHTSELEAIEQVARYRKDKDRKETVLVGFKDSFGEIHALVERSSSTDAPVLITGETGTGKNVVAKKIHYQSARRTHPFISLNCAAIPETLIESELFGVEKGAFTGAVQTRKGVFELADGGTLFLDEIGEMPTALQAKLLSVLEERQVKRVGAEKYRPVNVRIIAATNAISGESFSENRFRKDLFYRLSVLRIHLPPLRERAPDIPDLCRYFISQLAPNRGIEIPPAEIEYLQNYSFPGNVRELRNVLERALLLQEGARIYPSKIIDFAVDAKAPTAPDGGISAPAETFTEDLPLAEIERRYILAAFAKNKNNLARTAAALDISLSTLKRKLREFGAR